MRLRFCIKVTHFQSIEITALMCANGVISSSDAAFVHSLSYISLVHNTPLQLLSRGVAGDAVL